MVDVLGCRDASLGITGAASGLGAAAARILVDLGALDAAPGLLGSHDLPAAAPARVVG